MVLDKTHPINGLCVWDWRKKGCKAVHASRPRYLQVQVPLLQGAWFGTRSATSSCFVLLGILLRGQQWIPSMEALIVTNRLQPSSMQCNLTGIACYEQGRIESQLSSNYFLTTNTCLELRLLATS